MSMNGRAEESMKHHFLKSAFTRTSLGKSDDEVLQWLKEQNEQVNVRVHRSTFSGLKHWLYDESKHALRHETGKFFSINGIKVTTNWGERSTWEQPIINQPEIGYLGCLVKEFDGVLHFLMQAKIEPGNINKVQLSPTLQATRSNFTRVHNGKKPDYLDLFRNAKPSQILLDQLQSEQGARFLRKRNRNIVVRIEDDIEVKSNFIWLTVGQIKSLMSHDHVINMDTRTVISGLPFGTYDLETCSIFTYLAGSNASNFPSVDFLISTLYKEGGCHPFKEIISKITSLKSEFDLLVEAANLKSLSHWMYSDQEIYHESRGFFRVIPVDVEIGNREVQQWSQPMIEPAQEGLCAFIGRRINGVLHFAMQLKLECGNHDIIELAPTVQTLTGDYKKTSTGDLPFLDYVLQADRDQIVLDTFQSEEGGRFFQEQNRNMIVIAPDQPRDRPEGAVPFEAELYGDLPNNYIWMTLYQLGEFIRFNNYLNIQARSLIAAVSFLGNETEVK